MPFFVTHVILISCLVFAAGGRDCDICLYDERQKRTTVVAMKNRGWFRSHILNPSALDRGGSIILKKTLNLP